VTTFQNIQEKLEQFIRKYYTNELIKGAILFFSIGLLYFLFTLLIEYFLWLNSTGRTLLFWMFVAVEVTLFARFIIFPLAKLFKLQKGIDYDQASRIIGNHFPEVSDKLLNVLQLNKNPQQSELLLASIEQKSATLQPVPFQKAVDFKNSLRYLKYAAIPVVIYLLFTLTGNSDIFSGSYTRVVNYNTAYEPPAPFSFFVVNEDLKAIENKPFTLKVGVAGNVLPENVLIEFNGESYYLQPLGNNQFQHTFAQPTKTTEFRLKANAVTSKPYQLEVLPVPSLISFEMFLDYPAYTGKSDEALKSTGNATIPEGTKVIWKLNTRQTDQVKLKTADTTYLFQNEKTAFELEKNVYSRLDYEISTSNKQLPDFESLAFRLQVIKDQYPEIAVEAKQDTINQQIIYYRGMLNDDYGLTKLQLVYYPESDEKNKKTVPLPVNKTNFDQFLYVFPGDLPLQEGTAYSYYFEVFDNDGVNGAKSSKSSSFSFIKLTKDELEKQQLKDQNQTIQNLDKQLQNFEEQKQALEELTKTQKQKTELNWNDKQKLEEFIKRQKQQEEMMKNFSEKLKDNLEEFQKENKEEDKFKEQLKERLEENEKKAQENEKLLDELEKLKDKLEKEDLIEKLEQISKQNKNQQRNLEQLLELTKRYYVERKAQKLNEELQKMAEEQEKLANSPEEENTAEKQQELNEKFDAYREEMKELQEENKKLQKPLDIPDNRFDEMEVQDLQQDAKENLEQNQQQDAQEKQKDAAKKMQQMTQQMAMQMMSGGSQQAQEDADMLRQILDNLVVFSHSQEDLMTTFKTISYRHPDFGKKLVLQNDLRQNFKHVDDSLFALAMRNPMIGGRVNDLISEAQYNIDKSLENFADNRFSQATGNQQYTVTAANDLAVLLDIALENMQMQMSGTGQGESGEGKGFQLPDIIQQQESLMEKMEEGMQNGEGEDGEQGEGNQSSGENQGEGQEGNQGSESGNSDGNQGEGSSGKDGENGKDGPESDKLGDSEEMSRQLFEIYMQQQLLRMQLEEQIRKEGLPADARELVRKMEEVEQELLEKGFNRNTLNKMNDLKHQLLKLEKATYQQGEKEERQGRTNEEQFELRQKQLMENAQKYFNTVEILNRESLPFRQEYKQKVQTYFNTTND
jgi:hypothetical protein